MNNITKKKTFSVILALFLVLGGLFSPRQTYAQTKWWNQGVNDFAAKVNGDGTTSDNEIFGERYTAAQVNWIINSLALSQAGHLAECFSPNVNTTTCLEEVQNSGMASPIMFLATLNDGIITNRPASGINYISEKIQKLNPVQTAYAQGFGYTTLAPLQKIWTAIRNLSFGLMSFVIIILAFMIMLRQKISAQAVITAQSALPKVVIALIFITFSYAIAGLLIDLSYVALGILSLVVAQSGLIVDPPNIVSIFTNLNNPFGAFTKWVEILGGALFTVSLGGFISAAVTGGFGAIVGAVSGVIAVIVLALGLVAFFRIFVTMLRAFATVVFLIIGAPLIGLGSVISVGPGIGGWIKQMVSQLAVFVGICASIMLAHMIFWTMAIPGGWLSQALTDSSNFYHFKVGEIAIGNAILLPGYSGFPIQIIAFFLGFGVLFSAPKIATGLRDQIATGRASYGADTFGTMMGAGIPIVGGLAMGQMNRLQTAGGNLVARNAGRMVRSGIEAIRGNGGEINNSQSTAQSVPTSPNSISSTGANKSASIRPPR